MKNITETLKEIYIPFKAIVLYTNRKENGVNIYVEGYDMDDQGKPINACPLSAEECCNLAQTLKASTELKTTFLQPNGILPENILYLNASDLGCAVWFTKAQPVNLFFKKELGINNGKAIVPAMVWKATKTELEIYAIKDKGRPKTTTKLYDAPFFNVHEDGSVCMGTVNVQFDKDCALEDFILTWEQYFWNSKFSHMIAQRSPVNGNIVQLWQEQVNSNRPFPLELLREARLTLKDILK